MVEEEMKKEERKECRMLGITITGATAFRDGDLMPSPALGN